MSLEYTKIPDTDFIVPTADQNFLPSAIERKTIMLEDSIANIKEVRELNGTDTVVDIGALYGDTAIIFAEKGARVFAFEPQLDSCIAALWNTRHYGRVTVSNKAIGNGLPFIVNDNPLNGNLGTRTLSVNDGGDKSVMLDELFLDDVTMIKIDCEGFEYFALEGAKSTIRRFRPILIIEIYPEMLEKQGCNKAMIYKFLTDLEYQIEVAVGEEDSVRWDIVANP